MRQIVRFMMDVLQVGYAVIIFLLLKKSPSVLHRFAMMRMHCTTNGRFSDLLASVLAKVYGQRSATHVTGLIGDLTVTKQTKILQSLDQDGFYVFENRLPKELCDAIEQFAIKTPALVEGKGSTPGELEVFDRANPGSITYRLQEEEIAKNPGMQQLMADPALLAVAEGYIGATPSLSMLNLWWSTAFGDDPGADAAQMFHFDFDPPPKWLLIFVYLTDVGLDNGPHVYVRGSHKAGHPAAKELLKRGYVRISDEEIAQAFGSENIIEIHGARGTVLAVDTRGFHKGKMLNQGHRLMAQLTFSYPVFAGAHGGVKPLNSISAPELLAAVSLVPKVFSRYFPRRG